MTSTSSSKITQLTHDGLRQIIRAINNIDELDQQIPMILQVTHVYPNKKQVDNCIRIDISDGYCFIQKCYVTGDNIQSIQESSNPTPLIKVNNVVINNKVGSFNFIITEFEFLKEYENTPKIGNPLLYQQYENQGFQNPQGDNKIPQQGFMGQNRQNPVMGRLPSMNVPGSGNQNMNNQQMNYNNGIMNGQRPQNMQQVNNNNQNFNNNQQNFNNNQKNMGNNQSKLANNYQGNQGWNYQNQNNNLAINSHNRKPVQIKPQQNDLDYDPILKLFPEVNKWKIKVRVTAKSDIRNWDNKKSGKSGKVFSVDLIDVEKSEINMAFFNDDVDLWGGVLQVGQIYIISDGSIRPNNSKNQKNQFSITCDKNTHIEQVAYDDNIIPKHNLEFSTTKQCYDNKKKDEIVNVIGIIGKKKNVEQMKLRSGEMKEKMTFTIYDDSKVEMECTLWGNDALREDIQEGIGLLLKQAKIGEYLQVKNFSMGYDGSIITDQDLLMQDYPQFQQLMIWRDQQGGNVNLTTYQVQGVGGDIRELQVIKQLQDVCQGQELNSQFSAWADIRATIVSNKMDGKLYYTSCNQCLKGVIDNNDGTYHCTAHNVITGPNYRYITPVMLRDSSGEIWATCGDEVATMRAYQAKEFIDAGQIDEMKKIFHDNLNKTWKFKILAKSDTYEGNSRIKYEIKKVTQLEPKKEAQEFLKQIQGYIN